MEALSVKPIEVVPTLGAYPRLADAIRGGCRLHAFRSGGGLRVVVVKDTADKMVAYGEHPHVETALEHAEADCIAGHRKYEAVYGKLHDHYLTGSSTPSSTLDRWLLRGYSFDISFDAPTHEATVFGVTLTTDLDRPGRFRFTSTYYYHVQAPPDTKGRVTAGETVQWREERGILYESSPYTWHDGEVGITTRVVENPDDLTPFDYEKDTEFTHETFEGLLHDVQAHLLGLFDGGAM